MSWTDHDDCALCSTCARHLAPDNQWPCLECGRMLCDTCECDRAHVQETCS